MVFRQKRRPIEIGTVGIVGIAIFLLAWNGIEKITDRPEGRSSPHDVSYRPIALGRNRDA